MDACCAQRPELLSEGDGLRPRPPATLCVHSPGRLEVPGANPPSMTGQHCPPPGECTGLVWALERDEEARLAAAECSPDSGFQLHFVCVLFILLRFI